MEIIDTAESARLPIIWTAGWWLLENMSSRGHIFILVSRCR